jgi:glycosyltransferase involved in cell wall biosynthesis
MDLSIAIITAPRPVPTIDLTIVELRHGGFHQPLTVFAEPGSRIDDSPGVIVRRNPECLGLWGNWLQAAAALLTETDSPFVMICEDDLLLSRGAAAGLQQAMESLSHDSWGIASLYTPLHNVRHQDGGGLGRMRRRRTVLGGGEGWRRLQSASAHWGALAWCFTRESLEELLHSPAVLLHPGTQGTDSIVSAALRETGRRFYSHIPSLCGHSGAHNSSVGHWTVDEMDPVRFDPDYDPTDVRNGNGSPRAVRGTTTVPAGDRPVYDCDVIIPYYRGVRWLGQTIEATLAQNFVNCHIHLINDDSPEDDTQIRRAFRAYPNLHWYRNLANVGPYRSYHQVWTRLRSEFFAVQDADDVPLPNRLWRAIHALETTGAEIYGAAMEQMLSPDVPRNDEWNRNYVRQIPFHTSGNRGTFSPLGNVTNGTMVCRRKTFERLNGFAGIATCSCDLEFITRAHYAGCRFYYDTAVIAVRRVHHRSLSRGGDYRMGTAARAESLAEWGRRYELYRAAASDFDYAAFGTLHDADPDLTIEVTDD